jgi:hypothetical protein
MGRNADAHRAPLEHWNRRDFDARVSTLVGNFTYEDHASGGAVTSRDEFKAWVEDAIPGGWWTIDSVAPWNAAEAEKNAHVTQQQVHELLLSNGPPERT